MTEQSDLVEYFSYLDDLRENGETNMYGAGAYLRRDFDLSRDEASKILVSWMKTFDGNSPLEARVAKAMGDQS